MHSLHCSFRGVLGKALVTAMAAATALTCSADGSFAVYDRDEALVGPHIAPALVELVLGSTKYAVSLEARQADRKVLAFHISEVVFEEPHCSGVFYVPLADLPNTLSPRAVVLRQHQRTLVYPAVDVMTKIDARSRLTPDGNCSRYHQNHLQVSALAEPTDVTDIYRRPFHIM